MHFAPRNDAGIKPNYYTRLLIQNKNLDSQH